AAELQSRQRSRARPKLVRFDAQALEHADVEIAQGRRVLWLEGEMLAVLETTTGEENRQVLRGMAAAVAEVAAQENGRAVEQIRAVLLRLLEPGEQVAHG